VQFEFEVGQTEKHLVRFKRNWFTGALKIMVDNKKVASKSPLNPATHFSLELQKSFEFQVGSSEVHAVRLEQIRPLVGAGLSAHTYRVFIDEVLQSEHQGY
jgi:hypothetical protein